MKINFSKAALTELDGTPMVNSAGEPIYADLKLLANQLALTSNEQSGIQYVDRMDMAIKINKGEELDLERPIHEALKRYIENHPNLTGFAIQALLRCFENVDIKKKK